MSLRSACIAATFAGTLTACGLVTGLSTDYTFTDGPIDGAAADAAASDGGRTDSSGGGDGGALGDIGCSDGTRETFKDRSEFPRIAGCAGGWQEPGLVFNSDTSQPRCGRRAGNDGQFPDGSGSGNGQRCSVEDLCAEGWHVCGGGGDVANSGGSRCDPGPAQTFWATRAVTNATNNSCSPSSSNNHNNIVGCGTLGESIGGQSCGPLNRFMTSNDCSSNSPWECGDGLAYIEESAVVIKKGPDRGGVLCCKN